jgi:hypothetical protein
MQYVQRMKSKWMLKIGMKNNATKQMHFRAQVRFWEAETDASPAALPSLSEDREARLPNGSFAATSFVLI